MLRRAVEYLGDLLARPVRTEGEMPGAFLDLPDDGPQSPVYLPALIQGHLAIQHRPEERVREAQHVTVALDDAVIDGLIDRDP